MSEHVIIFCMHDPSYFKKRWQGRFKPAGGFFHCASQLTWFWGECYKSPLVHNAPLPQIGPSLPCLGQPQETQEKVELLQPKVLSSCGVVVLHSPGGRLWPMDRHALNVRFSCLPAVMVDDDVMMLVITFFMMPYWTQYVPAGSWLIPRGSFYLQFTGLAQLLQVCVTYVFLVQNACFLKDS